MRRAPRSPRGRPGRPKDRGADRKTLRPLGLQFNDAVLLMDEAGRLLDVNDRALATYGYSREQLLRLNIRDLRAPEGIAEFGGQFQVVKGAEAVRFETLHRRGDGGCFPVEVSARSFLHQGERYVQSLVRDISERRRLEADLRRLNELLHETQSLAQVGGWELDLATGALFWTEETYRIHDTSPAEYAPTVATAVGFYAPESVPVLQAALDRAVREASPFDLELQLITAAGRRIWVHTTCRPVCERGRVVKVLGAFQDVTARHRAEERIRRMNDELEQRVAERTARLASANQELEAFAYSISHDLRGPLRAIDGFSHVLLEDYGDRLDAEGRRCLGRVRLGAQHMGRLIEDLLKLSHLGRGELDRGPMDLGAQAAAILAALAQRDPDRRVAAAAAPGLRAFGDQRLVRIALENLLDNAWKYSARTPAARIEFGARLRDGERAFFVRDNGAGFDMAHAAKLFTPFGRLHSSQEFEGTGIGLAIAQRIVLRHGGRIWAEAEVGKGATFFFTLPDVDRPAGREGDTVNEFDARAAQWDLDPAKVERARLVAEAILAQAGPLSAARALEVGCGTGLLGFALQPHLGHLTLADASPGMLAVLREKIAASGAGNMTPLALDLTGDPVPGAPYDLVCTLMTLHHIPDTDGALARFHALLAPGGLLCISDLDLEDGSFHGPEADVHRGFGREDLAARLARAGFRDPRFSTPFTIDRDGRSYPAFLVLAERAPGA